MRLSVGRRARKALEAMNAQQRDRANRALKLFIESPRHPSLNFEKLAGRENLYSIRLSRGDRAILRRAHDEVGEVFELLLIGPHDTYRDLP